LIGKMACLVEVIKLVSAWHCHGYASRIFRVLIRIEGLFTTRFHTCY
jgi:hypothetical protein